MHFYLSSPSEYLRSAADKRPITLVCASSVIVLCMVVFIGWHHDMPRLRSILPSAPQTTPLTAVMLLMTSLSILFSIGVYHNKLSQSLRWTGILVTFAVVLTAFWTGIQYIFDLKPDIELILYPKEVTIQSAFYPGRPSPQTVLSSIIIGFVVLLHFFKPGYRKFRQILVYAGLVIPWIALFGYASLANPFYSIPGAPETVMSPLTALGFILLCVGVMGLTPSSGPIELLKARTSGGFIARILLPIAVIVPLLMSWFFNYASFTFLGTSSIHIAASWGLTSVFMGALSIFGATHIHNRDVTREQLFMNLKNSEMKIKKIMESSPDALVIVNNKGMIVMVNGQTENLFGYPANTLINQPVEILMPDRFKEIHAQHRELYQKKPSRRAMASGLELYGQHKNGHEFPAEISLSPINMNFEVWTCSVIRDITDRKKKEEDILKLNEELKSFAYYVSHDLRAPLRSIYGFTNILKEDHYDTLNGDGKEAIEVILRNAVRMETLIDVLLDFSRLGRREIKKEKINIYQMVNSVLENIKGNSKAGLSKIKTIVHDLPDIYGDHSLIQQVFVNLISNAVKYSSKLSVSRVEVGVNTEKGFYIFYVKDNGTGFDMKYSDKLFKVFQRLHSEREFEGTGIGLAIVKSIVEKHNGKVWAESSVGNGATFYFSIPNKNN